MLGTGGTAGGVGRLPSGFRARHRTSWLTMAPERSVTTRVCSQPGCPNPASQLGPRPANTPPGTHVYLYGGGPFGSPALTLPEPPSCPEVMMPTRIVSPFTEPPPVGTPGSGANAGLDQATSKVAAVVPSTTSLRAER